MSEHTTGGKRRVYPQAQYQVNAAVAPAVPQFQQTPYYNQQPGVSTGQSQPVAPVNGVYGQNYGVDQVSQGVQNMNISNGSQDYGYQYGQPTQPVQPVNGAYGGAQPVNGAYGGVNQYQIPGQTSATAPQQTAPVLPLNQLYSTDLLRDLPPPIAELDYPPPPLVLPQGATLTGTEQSNSPPDYFRSTLNVIPNNNSLLKKSKLPFALIVRPYISLHDEDKPIPVVSDTIISRCRRCRCYINPFVQFTEQGRRWKCNLCNLQNDVPSGFDYNQLLGQSMNRYDREELNYAVNEFIAPPEYMSRAPQPMVYAFAIDVSKTSVQSGLLSTVARTILESLDRLPNKDGRTRVAFIGVDSSLHFFKIPTEGDASLMVVADIDEPFLPSPEGLLVNLKENRESIEKLLYNLPNLFLNNMDMSYALGPALKSAHKLISPIGGKVVCFGSTLPNLGIGKLTVRDEKSFIGKPKEAQQLLTNNNAFYKSFAVECNKSQVTIDMFLTAASYQDIASLSNLPRFTAGQTHFYPAWSSAREEDVIKLSKEISNHLSMEIAVEAVLRVRGTSGLKMSAFYGNFFNRSSDLCSFPTFPRDQGYVIEVSIEENISRPYVCVQAGILHTTSFGERRIRVTTLGIPVSSNLTDIYASADQLAITNYYTHKAVEKVLAGSLSDSREYLVKQLVDILAIYKKELVAGNVAGGSSLQLSTNLKMLPLLLHSLTKHMGLRNDRVPSDHRSAALNALASLPLPQLIKSIYPTIYSLHDMADDCGLPSESGEVVLPEAINASAEKLEKYGLYLIDNSTELFLWVGGDSVPQLVEDVFGLQDIHSIPIGKSELPVVEGSEFNGRLRSIIQSARTSNDSILYKNLFIIKGGSPNEPITVTNDREIMALRVWALSGLVEDKNTSGVSYREFLGSLREKINN